jgi:hypothetical protein
MSFIDNKGSLVDQVGLFKTIGDLPKSKNTSSLSSVNSKTKNTLPFLMDVLSIACIDNARKQREASRPEKSPTATGSQPSRSNFLKSVPDFRDVGRCEGKKILIEILIEFFPELVRIVKEGITKAFKETLSCSSDFTVPNPTPSITVDVKTIDFADLMKVSPTSFAGSLVYGSPSKDFNRFMYDTIQNPGVTNTWNGPNGPLMDVTFNNPSNVTLKINNNYGGKSFNGFVNDYMNSTELFSRKNLMSNMMDSLFGNISSNIKSGLDVNIDNEKTNRLVDKILDSDPCVDEVVYDDSYFTFSNEELAQIERDASNKTLGVRTVDLGCGLVETQIDDVAISGLTTLDTVEATKVEDVVVDVLNRVSNQLSSFGDEKDKQSIENGFSLDMIFSIPKSITKVNLTPKVLALYQISNYTVNGTVSDSKDGSSFAKKSRIFFEFVVRESFAALVRIIFEKLKGEIVRLIRNVAIIIIKEQVKKYVKQLTSLFSGSVNELGITGT